MAQRYQRLARQLVELGNQCTFRTVRAPSCKELSEDHVHLLGDAVKGYLFRNHIPFPKAHKETSATVYARLKALSPSTAQQCAIKSDDVTALRLRLYYGGDRPPESPASYICMSYRWPEEYRKLRRSTTTDAKVGLPTSPFLFQAVLEERQTPEEGLWLDQASIRQADAQEKETTVGAMDLIYKSARAVVVAIEDIEISQPEAQLLEAYCDDARGLTYVSASVGIRAGIKSRVRDPAQIFHGLVKKLTSSTYFERAWCQHELRLGRNHIFLIRCSNSSDSDSCRVLRITGSFLYYMFLLYSRDSSASSERIGASRYVHSVFLKLEEEQNIRNDPGIEPAGQSQLFESYVHSMAEVFGNKAGGDPLLPTQALREYSANRDKMSIILNTVNSGLAVRQDLTKEDQLDPPTLHECYKYMMIIALAAGDPVALCTTGQQLLLEGGLPSWLCWPHSGDLEQRHFLPMSPVPVDSHILIDQSPACQFVELDVIFVGSVDTNSRRSDPAFDVYLTQACGFMSDCIHHKLRGSAPRWASWREPAGSGRTLYRELQIYTLAHAFQGGLEWCAHISDRRAPGSGMYLREALTSIFDKDFRGRKDNWWGGIQGPSSATAVLRFLDYLTSNSLHEFTNGWWPFSFTVPSGHYFLAFSPTNISMELAIPTAVQADEYDFLARCWLLQRRREGGSTSEWTMLGKSHLFGTASFAASDAPRFNTGRRQRVYGR